MYSALLQTHLLHQPDIAKMKLLLCRFYVWNMNNLLGLKCIYAFMDGKFTYKISTKPGLRHGMTASPWVATWQHDR